MGDPVITPESLEAPLESLFQRHNFSLKDLNSIPKRDETRTIKEALEKFEGVTLSELNERLEAEGKRLSGTIDEQMRVAMGPLAAEWDELKRKINEADRTGNTLAQRTFLAGGSLEFHRVFDAIGKVGVARTLHREGHDSDVPKDWNLSRAQLADTPTKGGVAIPTITAEEYMMVRASYGVGRALFQSQSLGRAMAMILPVVDVEPTPGKHTTENSTKNETDLTLKAAVDSTTTAAMLSAVVYLSFKIPPEVLAEMTSLIGVLLTRRMGDVEDTWIFNNTDPWNGVLQTVTGEKVIEDQTADGGGDGTSFADLSFKAINGVKFKVHPQSMGAGVYTMHPEHWETVTGLVDTTNRPLDIGGPINSITPNLHPASPLNAQQPHATLRGRPVFFVPGMPGMSDDAADTKFISYFDPFFGRIGISQEFQIKASEETKLDLLMRTIVGYEAFAFRYFIPSGGAYIKTAAGS